MSKIGLIAGFLQSMERFASRPALVVSNERLSYLELWQQADKFRFAILLHNQQDSPLTAVLADRSKTAYSAILGILAAGKGYVPLNPKFPVERSRRMLQLSGCRTLIAGGEALTYLAQLLPVVDRQLTVIVPDEAMVAYLEGAAPGHNVISCKPKSKAPDLSLPDPVEPAATAYLLFTSGSTGEPKGVAISHSNVLSYIDTMCSQYDITEHDRISQQFDLTFDLSVHDMFVCWQHGACLYSLPEKSRMAPAKFIRNHELTLWFSVPSLIGVLDRMRLISPNCFPTLKYSFFCGEALSATSAAKWQQAAPNSTIQNLYGPTETTIAITGYRWDSKHSPQESLNGIVPIGHIFKGQQFRIIDQDGRKVPAGACGELCLSGSQVAGGYWNNPAATERQFVQLAGEGDRLWYRTGDLVKQDTNDCLYYFGRVDHQVKVRGYRVELQEIEAVLRQACGSDQVVALASPAHNDSSVGILAYIAGVPEINQDVVLDRCRRWLPDYMVPRRVFLVGEMPRNANGKIDRVQLLTLTQMVQNETTIAN
jgi:amino acid adenylation domain-containing protein